MSSPIPTTGTQTAPHRTSQLGPARKEAKPQVRAGGPVGWFMAHRSSRSNERIPTAPSTCPRRKRPSLRPRPHVAADVGPCSHMCCLQARGGRPGVSRASLRISPCAQCAPGAPAQCSFAICYSPPVNVLCSPAMLCRPRAPWPVPTSHLSAPCPGPCHAPLPTLTACGAAHATAPFMSASGRRRRSWRQAGAGLSHCMCDSCRCMRPCLRPRPSSLPDLPNHGAAHATALPAPALWPLQARGPPGRGPSGGKYPFVFPSSLVLCTVTEPRGARAAGVGQTGSGACVGRGADARWTAGRAGPLTNRQNVPN
jgi:hypothetical protein